MAGVVTRVREAAAGYAPGQGRPLGGYLTTLGAYAERMVLSAPLLLPIPNGLDVKRAALTEPQDRCFARLKG